MEDNAGCLAVVNGPQSPARTKHIAIRIGFIRDLIKSKRIQVKACPTAEMLADPLTKPLGAVDLKRKMASMIAAPEAPVDSQNNKLDAAGDLASDNDKASDGDDAANNDDNDSESDDPFPNIKNQDKGETKSGHAHALSSHTDSDSAQSLEGEC